MVILVDIKHRLHDGHLTIADYLKRRNVILFKTERRKNFIYKRDPHKKLFFEGKWLPHIISLVVAAI